jgi:hypothetical protein
MLYNMCKKLYSAYVWVMRKLEIIVCAMMLILSIHSAWIYRNNYIAASCCMSLSSNVTDVPSYMQYYLKLSLKP